MQLFVQICPTYPPKKDQQQLKQPPMGCDELFLVQPGSAHQLGFSRHFPDLPGEKHENALFHAILRVSVMTQTGLRLLGAEGDWVSLPHLALN